MGRLLGEYATLIAGQGLPSDRFWKLEKRLRNDMRKVGVRADMRRSTMVGNLQSLLGEGAITMDDIVDGFSEELRQKLLLFLREFL